MRLALLSLCSRPRLLAKHLLCAVGTTVHAFNMRLPLTPSSDTYRAAALVLF